MNLRLFRAIGAETYPMSDVCVVGRWTSPSSGCSQQCNGLDSPLQLSAAATGLGPLPANGRAPQRRAVQGLHLYLPPFSVTVVVHTRPGGVRTVVPCHLHGCLQLACVQRLLCRRPLGRMADMAPANDEAMPMATSEEAAPKRMITILSQDKEAFVVEKGVATMATLIEDLLAGTLRDVSRYPMLIRDVGTSAVIGMVVGCLV